MDAQTAAHYQAHAAEIAGRYESASSSIARHFAAAFPPGTRILDVGAGSGRDLAALLAAGHDAWGVEPVAGLMDAALHHHPQLVERIAPGALPALGQPFGGQFDGVVCSAVLMHVPDHDLFDAASALRAVLRPHGRLLLSGHVVTRYTWSDRPLGTELVVDHMIPFALWGCNDLGNLVAAHGKVNASKSDKLPTPTLLQIRRPAIVQGLQLLREDMPAVFDFQASHLLGRSPTGVNAGCQPPFSDHEAKHPDPRTRHRGPGRDRHTGDDPGKGNRSQDRDLEPGLAHGHGPGQDLDRPLRPELRIGCI